MVEYLFLDRQYDELRLPILVADVLPRDSMQPGSIDRSEHSLGNGLVIPSPSRNQDDALTCAGRR